MPLNLKFYILLVLQILVALFAVIPLISIIYALAWVWDSVTRTSTPSLCATTIIKEKMGFTHLGPKDGNLYSEVNWIYSKKQKEC